MLRDFRFSDRVTMAFYLLKQSCPTILSRERRLNTCSRRGICQLASGLDIFCAGESLRQRFCSLDYVLLQTPMALMQFYIYTNQIF